MSEQNEIRDLDVSEQEGEDVKGGVKSPMPPEKNPGKPSDKRPVASGASPLAASPKTAKSPPAGRMPPS